MEEEIAVQELISNVSEVKESSINVIFNNQTDDSKSSEERLRRKRSINYLENESDSNSDRVSQCKDFKKIRKSNKKVTESPNKINGNMTKNKSEILPKQSNPNIVTKQRKKKGVKNEAEEIPYTTDNLDVNEEIQTNKLSDEENEIVIVRKRKSRETQNKKFKKEAEDMSPVLSKEINNLVEENTTDTRFETQDRIDNDVTMSKKKARKPRRGKNIKEDGDDTVENQDQLDGRDDNILNEKDSRYQEINSNIEKEIELDNVESANSFDETNNNSIKEAAESPKELQSQQNESLEVLGNVIKDSAKEDDADCEDNQSKKSLQNEVFILKKAPGRPKKNGEITYRTVKVEIKIKNKRRGRPPKITVEGDNNIGGVKVIRKTPILITNADGELVKRSVGRPRKSLQSSLNGTIISEENQSETNNDTDGSNPKKRIRRSKKLLDESVDEENDENVSKKQRKNIKMIKKRLEFTDDEWQNRKKTYKKELGRPPKSLSLIKMKKLIARSNGKPRGRPRRINVETVDQDDKISKSPQITTQEVIPELNEVVEDKVTPEKRKRRSKKLDLPSNNESVEIQTEPLKSTRIKKKNSALLIKRAKENITSRMNVTSGTNRKTKFPVSKVSPGENLKSNPKKAAEAPNTVLNIMNAAARRASLDKLANLEALLSKLEEEHENTKELLRLSELKLVEHK